VLVEERELWIAVIDGVASEPTRDIGYPTFSPDGTRVAYSEEDDSGMAMIVDGREGPRFRSAGGAAFSPDSKLMVYRAMEGESDLLIVGDRKLPLAGNAQGSPVFNADGTRIGITVLGENVLWWKVFPVPAD
jgi:hypothetical protein